MNSPTLPAEVRIPRDRQDDCTEAMAARRREFLYARTGADLSHVGHYSLDPAVLPDNIENLFGVAQVPIGLAGCSGRRSS